MPYHSLKIVQIIQETPDARSFVFDVPPDLAERFRYKAGQFLTFRVTHPEGEVARCYSLSSSPEIDARPKVTVKRVVGGRGSNWFNDALVEGATIEAMPPAGRFLLVDGGAPILLFAGGSGITPVLSLIKSALKTTQRRVRLFYANRDRPSIIFRAELETLALAHAGRLEVIHHLDAEHGLTSAAKIEAAMADGFDAGAAYLCGPGPFMTLVEDTLLKRGMAPERVIIERFEASANAAVPIPDDDDRVVPETITIRLEGKTHTVPYQKGQTILQAARAAGLSPNSACEEGFCASCAAKRVKGEIMLAANDIYTQEDLDNGWVLTCQGHAFGREVEINYDVV
ncbi:MAG: ferredoxin--NADP reductase [Alphaproteobacteria bacterium]|nr:ferredoxin--NADP reductase [Alphaproteobacteria bacterium]MCW5741103.1 ferredoxin--NADP reductase [Alphaproteobacteria bacterium]